MELTDTHLDNTDVTRRKRRQLEIKFDCVQCALSSGVLCPGCNKVNTGSERTNNFLLLTHKDCQLSTTGPPPLSL